MKIAILHHDLEQIDLKFKNIFEQRGAIVDLVDIRKTSEDQLSDYEIIFNRVYSSIASIDFEILSKTLQILKKLSGRGVKCVNSHKASLADYDKFELFRILKKEGIYTPPTLFVGFKEDIESVTKKAINEFGFPIVIKRNCGGKSYEVTRVKSENELISRLKKMFNLAECQGYKGGFILQKFIKTLRDHDCRLGVLGNKFAFSYARSLISRDSKDKWMASTSGGSVEFDYIPTKEEIEIATRASLAINAYFSESDIIMTKKGPCVIEVNLTPSYFIDSIEDLERMSVIVEGLLKKQTIEKINKGGIELEVDTEIPSSKVAY
jgi:glutathione synthase/RimK-type ligase-like ATP-grasp enzyme